MPRKPDFIRACDAEFWSWVWEEFLDHVEEHPESSFTQTLQMALERPPETAHRDEAFFKLGCAWVLYAQERGILQRVPKPGKPSLS
ncbi:MAG TPA: hypothetical protein VHS80_13905 [Chthoniobacterales bacterium]|jgi:hypothetical protein|nr:hypothetical protein [Chthoniobacterales bacterium]